MNTLSVGGWVAGFFLLFSTRITKPRVLGIVPSIS